MMSFYRWNSDDSDREDEYRRGNCGGEPDEWAHWGGCAKKKKTKSTDCCGRIERAYGYSCAKGRKKNDDCCRKRTCSPPRCAVKPRCGSPLGSYTSKFDCLPQRDYWVWDGSIHPSSSSSSSSSQAIANQAEIWDTAKLRNQVKQMEEENRRLQNHLIDSQRKTKEREEIGESQKQFLATNLARGLLLNIHECPIELEPLDSEMFAGHLLISLSCGHMLGFTEENANLSICPVCRHSPVSWTKIPYPQQPQKNVPPSREEKAKEEDKDP